MSSRGWSDSKAPLIAEAASRHRIRPDASVVRDLASEIEWAKVSRISPDDYPARATAAGRTVAGHDPEPWSGASTPRTARSPPSGG